ncbi:MAG TPA: aspartate--tRNA(Asn) ligase [Planctomycetaceae bacterium]|nr:aspartate--tRNA(Asn) ligase [Planctomycetaceae bacterium]
MAIDLQQRVPVATVQIAKPGESIVIAGWAETVKNLGKIGFITIRDRSGKVQVAVQDPKNIADLTQESVVAIKGKVQESRQKSGGNEVLFESMDVLSPAYPGVPIDVTGKTPAGFDTRLDNRYLDLRNPKTLAIFKVRSQINHAIRTFLQGEKFIEMQTPKIISAGAEGGATLFELKYFDRIAYLSQSQQLYKQMLLIAGFEKVFEIGPSFRAEKSNTMRHQTEFTQLDFEMAFINDEDDVLKVLERMFVFVCEWVNAHCQEQLEMLDVTIDVPKLPFPRIPYAEAIKLLGLKEDEDIGTEDEKKLATMIKERDGTDAFFITKYPYDLKPFYIMTDGGTSRGFDFEYLGDELVSGGQREHRYDILCTQIEGKGLRLKDFDFYTTPFKYGAPPHGGFGMGLDRLTMKLLKLPNVREAILFPRDPERLVP